jgi:hypothetical protein
LTGSWGLIRPGLSSTEDEEENEEFQLPQLLDLDGFLEFDDLDGTHALMVRALGAQMKEAAGWRLPRGRESTGVQLDTSDKSSGPQFSHLYKNIASIKAG